jgi:hypothetical protein
MSSSSGQCTRSIIAANSLDAVTLYNHERARRRFLHGTSAPGDGSSRNLSAAPSPGFLGPAQRASQPQYQLRSPAERAEKLQKFLTILHEAIDLIDDDDDGKSDWL